MSVLPDSPSTTTTKHMPDVHDYLAITTLKVMSPHDRWSIDRISFGVFSFLDFWSSALVTGQDTFWLEFRLD